MTAVPHLTPLTIVHAADLADHDWQPVPDCPGVTYAELWRGVDFSHHLIRYAPDSRTAGHPHHAYHHLWIVSGSAYIAGQRVTAGSYVVIPPGTPHTVSGVGPDGCLVFQMHRPTHGRQEAEVGDHVGVAGG